MSRRGRSVRTCLIAVVAAASALSFGPGSAAPSRRGDRPDVVLITIDTLRSDHMSVYGYGRPTSPNLDRLIREGVRFDDARTVEPLTSPSLCSMITSREPQEHGSTRNGLRIRSGLASLPKELRYSGYRTAAFVGNWTLRDKLSGLGEHFDHYAEVLTRARWFGLIRSEATAEDINEQALDWLDGDRRDDGKPVFVWVHYVEPHAPYRLWEAYMDRLGIKKGNVAAADRYDTEIAFVDDAVGRLVRELGKRLHDPMFVFASDHGESLGEHDYWGHGRNLFETTLRVPMSITWQGHLAPSSVGKPALLIDLAPTVLRLLGIDPPREFEGYDWSAVLDGGRADPSDRVTFYQTHRGAVLSKHDSDLARRAGLLEVGLIHGSVKEIFRFQGKVTRRFDLAVDPGELHDLAKPHEQPSEALTAWMRNVTAGLASFDDAPAERIDDESAKHLRSLGYVD